MHKIKNEIHDINQDVPYMPEQNFLIVVPTARDPQWTKKVFRDLIDSCTYPTTILIRDGQGKSGKSGVLNRELAALEPSKHGIYCTIDDDIRLPIGWQHEVARAFALLPEYAAWGIDWGKTEEGQAYMIENNKRVKNTDIVYMPLKRQNIAGAVICAKSECAKAIGAYPIRPNDQRKYQMDEDGWRCGQFKNRGWKTGYVTLQCGDPTLLHAPDSKEYLEAKNKDINRFLGR